MVDYGILLGATRIMCYYQRMRRNLILKANHRRPIELLDCILYRMPGRTYTQQRTSHQVIGAPFPFIISEHTDNPTQSAAL